MPRGRKPNPDEIHDLRGDPGKRAAQRKARGKAVKPPPPPTAPASGSDLPAGCPVPPAPLAGEALAKWIVHAPALVLLGVLTAQDLDTLHRYCETWALLLWVDDELRKDPRLTFTTDKGSVLKNPLLTIRKENTELLRSLGSELGLSPVARQRIHAQPREEEKDEGEEYLNQGKQIRRIK